MTPRKPSACGRFRLLGTPELIGPGGDIIPLPARAFVLVLFLLRHGGGAGVDRIQVANWLWPESANAAGNLRQLVSRLRAIEKRAGFGFVRWSRTKIGLALESISIDLPDFEGSLRRLEWTDCESVLSVYRGELLEGVAITESDLALWIATQRAAVRNVLLTSFAALLDGPEVQANPRTAQLVAARLLEIDPYQEAAYRGLMRSFAATGQMMLATATYERCAHVLAQDLGTQPARETEDLHRWLKAVRLRQPMVDATAGPTDAAVTGESLKRGMMPRLVLLAPEREQHDQSLWELATLVLEDTIVRLCGLKTLDVVAAHTSWQLSTAALDEGAAGRFGIGYVMESAVRSASAGDAQLFAKLFDTRTRSIIWADRYAIGPDHLASSYRALSTSLALSLADAVERAEIARFDVDYNAHAYYWHLIGQKYLRYMDLANVRRALKAFRNSVSADPEFAPAYSGSARATQRQWLVLGRGDADLLAEAERIGTKAVSLDHRDARGYRELALCSLYRRSWDEAISNFAEAERLGRQYADLICDFGDALGHCGQPEEGLKKVGRAMLLNPLPPDQYWWNAAGLHFQLHDYRAAIAAVDKMGDPLPALRIAAASWAYLGDDKMARRCARKFLLSYPDFRISHWLSIVPNKNPDDQRHYELGLRSAGLHM